MNLILDIGNTAAKIAVFEDNKIIYKKIIPTLSQSVLQTIFNIHKEPDKCILSSVQPVSSELEKFIKEKTDQYIRLDHTTPLPLKNLYKSKKTLGYDRIAGVTGAYHQFNGSDLLIIDAGTAITFDFVDSKGNYHGGSISPGLHIRAKALHSFTAKLPQVDLNPDYIYPAKTTEDSINAGIFSGVIFEIEGYINKMKKEYPGLKTILTGGDTYLFDKKIKNIIFVDSNLNLNGLNRILEYNAQ